MSHNLLIYTNNFCFGYITVSCIFEALPGGLLGGWVVGKSDFNENQSSAQTWTWTLDFDLGFVNTKVFPHKKKTIFS